MCTNINRYKGSCIDILVDPLYVFISLAENLTRADILALADIIHRLEGLFLIRIKCIDYSHDIASLHLLINCSPSFSHHSKRRSVVSYIRFFADYN